MLIEGAKVLPKGKRVQWVGTTTHWLFRKDQWATVLDSRLTCNRTLKIQFDGDDYPVHAYFASLTWDD